MAEMVLPGQIRKRASRIGDREELFPRLLLPEFLRHKVIKILHKREGLDRSARLRGNDEERPAEVKAVGVGKDCPRVRAVQDGKVEKALSRAEDLAEDLGRKAGAPHPEEEGEVETVGPHLFDDIRDLGEPFLHRLRAVEPAETVCDLRRPGFPDGMVLPPDPFHDSPCQQSRTGLLHRHPALFRTKRHPRRHGCSLPFAS